MATSAARRQEPLSRQRVVAASMELARERGLDGVTMRALAAELDVTPMAVYYHVRNKDELVALVAESVLEDASPLSLADAGWETALRDHLLALWETLAKYPGLSSYMINLPTLGTTESSYAKGARFFEEAGFPPRLAKLAWSFALTFIHGRLSVDAKLDRSAARAAGLDTIAAREHVVFGVDAIIAGLKGMLGEGSDADHA